MALLARWGVDGERHCGGWSCSRRTVIWGCSHWSEAPCGWFAERAVREQVQTVVCRPGGSIAALPRFGIEARHSARMRRADAMRERHRPFVSEACALCRIRVGKVMSLALRYTLRRRWRVGRLRREATGSSSSLGVRCGTREFDAGPEIGLSCGHGVWARGLRDHLKARVKPSAPTTAPAGPRCARRESWLGPHRPSRHRGLPAAPDRDGCRRSFDPSARQCLSTPAAGWRFSAHQPGRASAGFTPGAIFDGLSRFGPNDVERASWSERPGERGQGRQEPQAAASSRAGYLTASADFGRAA